MGFASCGQGEPRRRGGRGAAGLQEALWGVNGEMDGDPLKTLRNLWGDILSKQLGGQSRIVSVSGTEGGPRAVTRKGARWGKGRFQGPQC